jgi:hypothetical protein
VIYEINTWVWLDELSRRHRRRITLETVPPEEWDAIARLRIDAVWFMGVWERSPAGRRIAREHPGLLEEYRRVLPDVTGQDVVGSPYCIHRYRVDAHLGGPAGLAAARRMLATRQIRLLLDFVPNHVARDHPWVLEHPEYLVQGNPGDLAAAPDAFFEVEGRIFAHGRDPHSPPWTDTVQVNVFSSKLRQALIDTLAEIAAQCDGVRCDMAMLPVNRVFASTWGRRVGAPPDLEFWCRVIRAVRQTHPRFLFIAEAYWQMESELHRQGFNFCYDKELYDRLRHDTAEALRLHLLADPGYQGKLVRFLENHDEPRAAATFAPQRLPAALVTIATLPGARLFHEGQFEGRKVRLPVQLGRRPAEPCDIELQAFHRRLLEVISAPIFRDGEWCLCERSGWPDNASHLHLAAWCWSRAEGRVLVVVNLSSWEAQGRVHLPWGGLAGRTWRLDDLLSRDSYERNGDEMAHTGLYVALAPWAFHVFRFSGDAGGRRGEPG